MVYVRNVELCRDAMRMPFAYVAVVVAHFFRESGVVFGLLRERVRTCVCFVCVYQPYVRTRVRVWVANELCSRIFVEM